MEALSTQYRDYVVIKRWKNELAPGGISSHSPPTSVATPPLQVDDTLLQSLALGPAVLQPSRANGFANMLETMRRLTRALAPGDRLLPRFPSLLVTADRLVPQGAFAEAQAQYLAPEQKQVGIVGEAIGELRRGCRRGCCSIILHVGGSGMVCMLFTCL